MERRSKEVVVAKYREDVGWTRRLVDAAVTVYDKDNQIDGDLFDLDPAWRDVDGQRWCSLPNIGRESHTYLYHIVKNYDDLADVTVFMQGRPFDHVGNALDLINSTGPETTYRPYSRYAQQFRKHQEEALADEAIRSKYYFYGNHLSIYRELFGKEPPDVYWVGIHGMFAVSREVVHRNPREVYEACLRKFDRRVYLTGFVMDDRGYDPVRLWNPEVAAAHGGMPNGEHFGWLFEYFWDLLFHEERLEAP